MLQEVPQLLGHLVAATITIGMELVNGRIYRVIHKKTHRLFKYCHFHIFRFNVLKFHSYVVRYVFSHW